MSIEELISIRVETEKQLFQAEIQYDQAQKALAKAQENLRLSHDNINNWITKEISSRVNGGENA